MGDRFQKLTIVLDREYSNEVVDHIVEAIKMNKFVGDVLIGEPMNPSDYMARTMIRTELLSTLHGVLSMVGGLNSKEDAEAWSQIEQIVAARRKQRGY